jgi:hypothetical protein
VHAPYLGQLSTLAPAFSAGSRGQLRDEDLIIKGLMHHAPRSGLIRRQGGQIGEIGPTALAHSAGVRARQGVKPHRPEWLPTDTTKSRFRGQGRVIIENQRPG